MTKHTYKQHIAAHLGLNGYEQCIVPDQVADNQKAYDGRTFYALKNGVKIRVKLLGDDYDLNGPGTGDMVVRRA